MAPLRFKYCCSYATCENKYYAASPSSNKHFFVIPFAPLERRKKWFEKINSNQVKKLDYTTKERKYICEDHFTGNNFTSTSRERLNKFAEPSIFTSSSKIKILQILRSSSYFIQVL